LNKFQENVSGYTRDIIWLLRGQGHRLPWILAGFLLISAIELIGLGLILPYTAVVLSLNLPDDNIFFRLLLSLNLPMASPFPGLILGVTLLIIFLVRTVAGIYLKYVSTRFAWDQNRRLRRQLLEGFFAAPYIENTKRDSATLIQTAENYTEAFSISLVLLLQILGDTLIVVVIFGFLISMSPQISFLIILFAALFTISFTFSFKGLLLRSGQEANKSIHRAIKLIQNSVTGYKEIKIFGKDDFLVSAIDGESKKMGAAHTKAMVIAEASRYLMEFGIIATVILIFSAVLVLDLGQSFKIPEVATTMLAILRIAAPVQKGLQSTLRISFYRPALSSLITELRRVGDNLDCLASEGPSTLDGRHIRRFQKLTLHNVSFKYPSRDEWAINNVSLAINRGEIIGIQGPSGSGKSTLVDLILGFLVPTKGEISFNNNISLTSNIATWRKLIAYIPQDEFFLDEDISTNISLQWIIDETSLKIMDDAIQSADLRSFVQAAPGGLSMTIGEVGSKLSGGERQRLSIARALFHQREVLVMDESTNALDQKTQSYVLKNIQKLRETRTIVIISHQPSVLAYCDKVFHVLDGRVQET
jgi:ATP-binding cassette, subfamily B, bacterial PglK